MTRKKLITIVAIIIVLIGSIVLALAVTKGNKQGTPGSDTPDVSVKTDKDTGEQTATDPAQTMTTNTDVVVLGLADLIDTADLATQQSDFLKLHLTQYAMQNLKGQYATLTIQPQNTSVSGDTVTTTVRLGDTTKTVALRFETGTNSTVMQVFITDPSNTGGGAYTSPTETVYPQ